MISFLPWGRVKPGVGAQGQTAGLPAAQGHQGDVQCEAVAATPLVVTLPRVIPAPCIAHSPAWTRVHPVDTHTACEFLFTDTLRVGIPEPCILQVLHLISNSPHCASQNQQGFVRQGEMRLGNRTLQTNRGGSVSCFVRSIREAKKVVKLQQEPQS